MHCNMNVKCTLEKTPKMKEVVVDERTIFVEHGYGRQAGAGWKGNHALHYYTYVIRDGSDLKNDVAFACGEFLRGMPKYETEDDRFT